MPPPVLSPSQFAERYRKLHPIYCTERPGPWNNEVFPYQRHLMDMAAEAIRTGKRGVVYMKAGQIGGTDVGVNIGMWLKVYYPGPILFMTSTENVASEFGRERWGPIIQDCELLQRKYLPNPHGDILVKRFTDGKIQMAGGQSVFTLQSTPYRHVLIDELDSLVENLGGEGNPIRLAEIRMASFTGPKLLVAWAHPTTKERGVGKMFYQHSDQRRAHVTHRCGCSFAIGFEQMKATGNDQDADNWHLHCPGCDAIIDDTERAIMLRTMEFRSVLPPEIAAKKMWIGAQISQFLNPSKSIRSLAQDYIESAGDENAMRVFVNKVLGETFDPKVKEVSDSELRTMIVVQRRPSDPDFYSKGQVPPWIQLLTGGQDSRSVELHYAIWGWGLRRGTDGRTRLCGALIDWNVIPRPHSLVFNDAEFHVFDDLIYKRHYRSNVGNREYSVRMCGHDIGYAPTQIPIIQYCRAWDGRAVPTKGASLTATSAETAPYAQLGTALRFKPGMEEIKDEASRQMSLNTYLLKTALFGWMGTDQRFEIFDPVLGTRKVGPLSLPENVDNVFLTQSTNEVLQKGKRTDELVWVKRGANHYSDCNMQAYGIALFLQSLLGNLPVDERPTERRPRPWELAQQMRNREPDHDPMMG
jgi:phage terminase large subunit GpA-like protein